MSRHTTHRFLDLAESVGGSGRIAAVPGDVLPRLSVPELVDLVRRLPADELDVALRHKLIPVSRIPGLEFHVACGERAKAEALAGGKQLLAESSVGAFHQAVRLVHGSTLLRGATRDLARRRPDLSASRRVTGPQLGGILCLAATAVAAAWVLPLHLAWGMASLGAGLFFAAVIALRILCLMPPVPQDEPGGVAIPDSALPVYSVLVPLFRETAVLGQLLRALRSLRYPAERLDIKLILEESDLVMQRAVADIALPPHFEVIIVPAGTPQTKPRALNYALRFARGALLTIYDAEDIPEPDQLWRAAQAFAALPEEVACLQAELAFYNSNENWLTRQFTIEYATLFGLLLPALAGYRLPLPLGGTSNHFRAGVLRAVGGWDPYNVTEDADLGLRLARAGYRTGTLASTTWEEANTRLGNWLRQRARWLKGFLVTWLVHMRDPGRLMGELGPSGFWAAQALTLGVFASALLHPLCTLLAVVMMVVAPPLPPDAATLTFAFAGLNLMVLVSGYAVTALAGARALSRQGIDGWWPSLATMPVYWLLMSAAVWLALWQFIVAPFHWNKTEHGLSSFQAGPARRG